MFPKAINQKDPLTDMADYHLERLNEENAKRWEDFNTTSSEGSLFHSLKWKPIGEKCSGIPWHYFLLFKNDAVFGLFPLVEDTIRGFRGLSPASYPMSLPAILKDYSDPFAMRYVIEELQNLERGRKKFSFIRPATLHPELFDTITTYPLFPYPFSHKEGEGDMVLDLSRSSPEKIWNTFSKKKRQEFRRFDKDGFEVTEVRSEGELEIFYNYYEENIKYIGAVPKPFSHFIELCNSMSDEIRITLFSKGSLVAGGVLTLADKPRKTVTLFYLSLNRNLPNKYSPSSYLYWEAIKWAWENNYEKASFGREYVKDQDEKNPRYRIKDDFGAHFEPIHSRLIPLTNIFAMVVRSKKYWDRWRSVRSHDQAIP